VWLSKTKERKPLVTMTTRKRGYQVEQREGRSRGFPPFKGGGGKSGAEE